jgi:cellulose synthase/poly-beta-1,6-N-acetylglucosamine synthase-like glycosyltransferase
MRGCIGVAAAAVATHVALTWAHRLPRAAMARRATSSELFQDEAAPVSIIVPAWRERGTIECCIRSLQEVADPPWEVVIVAGGPDGTYEAALRAVAGDKRFRVLEQEPRGKNAALMQGVEAARHDVLVFLDADSVVSRNWLAALVAPLASGANVSIGHYFPRRKTWVSLVEHMEQIQARYILGSTSIQGSGSVALQRRALAHIGGLPEDVRVGVDWDLGVRLAQVGERIVFADAAHVLTDRPATLGEFWRNELRWRRAHLALLWRHRRNSMRHPLRAMASVYFYGLSAAVLLASVAGIGIAALRPSSRPDVARLFALGAFWLLGRRATLAPEVAIYTHDLQWLRLAWTPLPLLLLSFAAAVAAMLSPRHLTAHFKGPRSPRTA